MAKTLDILNFVHRTASGCWEWAGEARTRSMAKGAPGYALVLKCDVPEELRHTVVSPALAHRWVWTRINGPIAAGMFICHTCDNPPCVNPAHLFMATPAENTADMVRKGRQAKHGRSETCRRGHQKSMYGGRWQCAACHCESAKRLRRIARKAA